MNELHIGEVISYLRKKNGLTQLQLAEGICTREYLCRLEKKISFPTTYIIDLLSQKLNEDIYLYYKEVEKHNSIDIHIKIKKLNDLFTQKKGAELRKLVTEYKKLPGFQSGEALQYILYSEALCSYYLDLEFNKSIDFCLRGLRVYKNDFSLENWQKYIYTNIELAMLNIIASCYCYDNNFDKGINMYLEILNYIEKFISPSLYTVKEKSHFYVNLYTNVAYNLSNNLIKSNKLDIALNLVDKAINISLKTKYMNLYPHLLRNKFKILYALNDYIQAKYIYNKAKLYYEDMLSSDEYISLIEEVENKYPLIYDKN